MYIIIIIIHVIACLVLVSVILLQAGKGGGLTEAFSGEAQSVLGTQAPSILKKATTISAIAFLCTSLLLGMVTARRGRSLFDSAKFAEQTKTTPRGVTPIEVPAIPANSAQATAPLQGATDSQTNPAD
ncbi:MAG: preprotein translocase subunit SecG [Candidatus Tantalella remota]|nr:preprotein translocase subunit SecG [Candidatus Tantalella remota]